MEWQGMEMPGKNKRLKPVTSHMAVSPRKVCHSALDLSAGTLWTWIPKILFCRIDVLKCELRDLCDFYFSYHQRSHLRQVIIIRVRAPSSSPSSSSSSAFLLTVDYYKCQRIAATSDFHVSLNFFNCSLRYFGDASPPGFIKWSIIYMRISFYCPKRDSSSDMHIMGSPAEKCLYLREDK